MAYKNLKLAERLFSEFILQSRIGIKGNFFIPCAYEVAEPCSAFTICNSFTTFTNISYSAKRENSSGKKRVSLMHQGYFDRKEKTKYTFLEAINMYKARERHLRGHIEFIYAALNCLEEFGVNKELEVYKALLEIMPKGVMVPRNIFQAEFYHYPKHQECAVQVLEAMEVNGVIPDSEVETILTNTFGKWGGPTKKFMRMMYWMPKFKYATPWPLPSELPRDTLQLAILALKQISMVDPATKISILKTSEVEDAIDDTWIVSAISPQQQELISQHCPDEPLKVEGPFGVYLKDMKVSYFILRAEAKPPPPHPSRDDIDDVGNLLVWMLEEESKGKELIKRRSFHEQDDGTILAICATGTSSRDSLLSWIRMMEKSNPALSNIPVLFSQSSPIGDVIPVNESSVPEKNS